MFPASGNNIAINQNITSRMKSKPLLIFVLFLFASMKQAIACSMFKITKDGKTLVGNNEDYSNSNTRMWFEKADTGKFGAVYVGFDDFFPQGGMNEVGLVFDGFSMNSLAVTDTVGKATIAPGKDFSSFGKKILQTCSNVTEVRNVFLKYNLKMFETALLLFVDKSGDYLVVEGDSLIVGNSPTYIQSNFYPSLTKKEDDVKIGFYQKGRQYLNQNSAKTSLSYCTNVMNAMHQDSSNGGINRTVYTTIYDLQEMTISLYYQADFQTPIKFDLKDELTKENRQINIPELFPNYKKADILKTQFSLTQLAGDYEEKPGFVCTLSIKNDSLFVFQNWNKSTYPIINTKSNIFQIPRVNFIDFTFSNLEGNLTQTLTIFQNGKNYIWKRKNNEMNSNE